MERLNLGILHRSERLKQLISQYPDYPIVVLAGQDANDGYSGWMYCSTVVFEIGEVLDTACPFDDELVCSDRVEFEERLEEWLWDKMHGEDSKPTEQEFRTALHIELAKYEPYWVECICVYADN